MAKSFITRVNKWFYPINGEIFERFCLKFSPMARLLMVCCLLASPGAFSLDPQFEADRLTMIAEQDIAAGNYSHAKRQLSAAKGLKTSLPAEFYFFEGQVLEHDNNNAKAKAAFDRYVSLSGKTGRFYRDALQAITRLEDKPSARGPASQEIAWGAQASSDQDYASKLQRLYKTTSRTEALRLHINSLLQFYGIENKSINSKTYYEIKIDKDQLITQIRNSEVNPQTGEARINSDRFSVYGIDPYVTSGCGKDSNMVRSCWINNPITGEPWLMIQPVEGSTVELSKALTLLIRNMQH